MHSFLQQYPYNMGEHTLTCTLSPNREAAEAEVTKKEVKKEEGSKGSSGLKNYPEGSGVVQRAADPPVEPSGAKQGPVPLSDGKAKMPAGQIETSESHLERAVREPPGRPAGTAKEKVDAGDGAPVAETESPGVKAEEMLLPPSTLERGEAAKDDSPELLEPPLVSAAEKEVKEEGEELAAPARGPPEDLSLEGKAGDVPPDCAVKPAVGEPMGTSPEELPPASDTALVGLVSPGVPRPTGKVDAPETNPVCDAVMAKPEPPGALTAENKPVPKAGQATEKKLEVGGEVNPEESVPNVGRAAEENPGKLLVKAGAETEKKPEKSLAKVGAAGEDAADAGGENNEGTLTKGHPNKGSGPAKPDEPPKEATSNSSLPARESPFLGKVFLKAVVSLPDISKSRVPGWRNQPSPCPGGEQKSPSRPETRDQATVEKKMAPKEAEHPHPGSVPPSLEDGSRCKGSRSSAADGKGGNGRSSSQQEKDPRVESRASSKQSQEGESRTSSLKKATSSSTKVSAAGNVKTSKSGSSSNTKQKEEEELFPFNLDEFVTVDEVVEEVESPVKTRRNPPRGKRKDGAKPTSSSEPSSKRRKGKSSTGRAAESELSFVTLDEIGEEEDVATHLMGVAGLEALSDPQGLVVVDEVMEEEELLSEAVKDPQSLVTLDEICDQEELGSQKDIPRSVFEEQDLKAEPLVTVDEIGEVEELPLNEPTGLNLEEVLQQKEEDEKAAAEDTGDGASSQVPDDPSALVTVDEIQEDNEDNPLVTLDEVNEDEDDFLADFNRLKEELNFVTVDEVGEEDEEEENTSPGKNLNEEEDTGDAAAVAGPEEEEAAAVTGPEEEATGAVAGPEEKTVLGHTSPKEVVVASKAEGKKPLIMSRGEGEGEMFVISVRTLQHLPLEQVAPSPIQPGLEHLQGWGFPGLQGKISLDSRAGPSTAGGCFSVPVPADLDYLVPKAGFFCQICSLFYADETSVKNHCKTPLHQQNMEKFMAKQKEEDNGGEEPSSR
ncbi:ZN638 protein, partial [Brachypteracias leptosomus]|nr:ZN638 protein [Brachypteracias leptosomus]